MGRPDDDEPEEWYAAAIRIAENRATNATFHGVTKTSTPTSWFKSASTPISDFRPPLPTEPTPRPIQNPVPMDIDATKRKGANPPVCYRCGEPGHLKPQCPKRFDIRHMTTEEVDEWMQQQAIDKDVAELKEADTEKDFPSSDE